MEEAISDQHEQEGLEIFINLTGYCQVQVDSNDHIKGTSPECPVLSLALQGPLLAYSGDLCHHALLNPYPYGFLLTTLLHISDAYQNAADNVTAQSYQPSYTWMLFRSQKCC